MPSDIAYGGYKWHTYGWWDDLYRHLLSRSHKIYVAILVKRCYIIRFKEKVFFRRKVMKKILLILTVTILLCGALPLLAQATTNAKTLEYQIKDTDTFPARNTGNIAPNASCCEPEPPTPPTPPTPPSRVQAPRPNRPSAETQGPRQNGTEPGQRGRRNPIFGQSPRNQPKFANLNLSGEQIRKIETLQRNYQKDIIDKKATMQKLELDKEAAEIAENATQVKKLIDDISKIEADIEKAKIDLEQNIIKELTPEQKELYKQSPTPRR